MATYLILYDRTISQSLGAALVAMEKYSEVDTDTVEIKDLEGVNHAGVDSYIATLSNNTYSGIVVTVPESSNDLESQISSDQLGTLRAKLLTALQGVAEVTITNADTHTTTTIGKAGETWVVNAYAGQYVLINGGTGVGSLARIKSNSATVLTIEGTRFIIEPDATSDFIIIDTAIELYTVGLSDLVNIKYPILRAWDELHTAHPPLCVRMAGGHSSPYNGGTATGGANTTITDANHNTHIFSAAFDVDDLIGKYVSVVSGLGKGQYRKITDNTANIITIGVAWTTNPDNTSVYMVFDSEEDLFAYERWTLIFKALFQQIDDGDVLRNWKRITNYAKLVGRGGVDDSLAVYPLEDSAYVDELYQHGLTLYRYSIA